MIRDQLDDRAQQLGSLAVHIEVCTVKAKKVAHTCSIHMHVQISALVQDKPPSVILQAVFQFILDE